VNGLRFSLQISFDSARGSIISLLSRFQASEMPGPALFPALWVQETQMPIKIQNDLPVKKILEDENIFVMDESRAVSQDIRPLEIAILNLMPLKEDTELDILRVLSNFPIQLEITFLTTATHRGSHVDISHLNKFYQTFDDVKHREF